MYICSYRNSKMEMDRFPQRANIKGENGQWRGIYMQAAAIQTSLISPNGESGFLTINFRNKIAAVGNITHNAYTMENFFLIKMEF